MANWSLARTPFFFVGPRPYRERTLAAYIHREHRRGRDLSEILKDRRVERCGSAAVVRAVLLRPNLIRELGLDVSDAFRVQAAQIAGRSGRRG